VDGTNLESRPVVVFGVSYVEHSSAAVIQSVSQFFYLGDVIQLLHIL